MTVICQKDSQFKGYLAVCSFSVARCLVDIFLFYYTGDGHIGLATHNVVAIMTVFFSCLTGSIWALSSDCLFGRGRLGALKDYIAYCTFVR